MALNITFDTYGTFTPNDFVIGSTVSSEITPFINIHMHRLVYDTNFNYHKPKSQNNSRVYAFKLDEFLNHIQNYMDLRHFRIGNDTSGTPIFIKVGKGYIADENDNILLMLGGKNTCLPHQYQYQSRSYSTGRRDDYVPPIKELRQASSLCLLISNKLVTDKKYALFYKKLEKNYISDAYTNDIEVRFLTSEKIEKLTYSNEFNLRFNTIEQLQSHLQNTVPKIWFLRDSDYIQGVNPGLNYSLSERASVYVPPAIEADNPFPTSELQERISELISSNSRVNLIDDNDLPY